MLSIQEYLISGRFLSTIGHFTVILLLFSVIKSNIEIGLADSASSSDKAEAESVANVNIYIFPIRVLC